MTWFKVDDGFSTHHKVDALEEDQALGIAAWVLCGSACARDMTDGVVTHAALRRTLAGWSPKDRERAASALVRVGLWTTHEGGWIFHDWSNYQPMKSDVEANRDAGKERQRRSRERRVTPSVTRDSTVTNAVTNEPVTPSVTRDKSVSHSDPSRPDPSRPVPCVSEAETGQPAESPAPTSAPEHTQGRTYVNGRLTLADTFRRAVEEHYKARQLPAPRECRDPMDKTWTDLAMWLHETRQARGWVDDAHNQARKTVEMFYASTDPRTVAAKHDLSFLRKRPGQYIGIE